MITLTSLPKVNERLANAPLGGWCKFSNFLILDLVLELNNSANRRKGEIHAIRMLQRNLTSAISGGTKQYFKEAAELRSWIQVPQKFVRIIRSKTTFGRARRFEQRWNTLKTSRSASLGSIANYSVGESFEVDATYQLALPAMNHTIRLYAPPACFLLP